jgi:sugar phosphate isomerase/epimerase
MLEKLAEEYQVRVCFHNHPRKPNDPVYKVWDPNNILGVVRDRSPLLGACADTGHWMRSGLDAMECLKILGSRTLSMHLKDRLDGKGEDQIFGKGRADVGAMLEYVKSFGFQGNVSIEYETNWEKSLPDVGQCVGFVRA